MEVQYSVIVLFIITNTTGLKYLETTDLPASEDFSAKENTHLLAQVIGIQRLKNSEITFLYDIASALENSSVFRDVSSLAIYHYITSKWDGWNQIKTFFISRRLGN